MPNTKSFIEHVVDLFATFEPVATRPMFGGVSLMIDGMMVGFLDDDELFLKADEESTPKFAAAGCKQFTYPTKQGPMPMAYYQPPAEALEDPRELRPWFDLAMGAAVRKQAIKDAKANQKRARQEAREAAAKAKGAAQAVRPVPKQALKRVVRAATKSTTKSVTKKAAKKAAKKKTGAAPARKKRPAGR